MPDKRAHRGAHPQDRQFFGPEFLNRLREALADFCWLLERGYAETSSLKLVGDRFSLTVRQRMAVLRCACSDRARLRRRSRQVDPKTSKGKTLCLDGYNVLTTVEAALAGGLVLGARDGCYRDLASVHGTYRKVTETLPSICLLGEVLQSWDVGPSLWYLDRPVSNSGRLKTILRQVALERGWDWQIELVYSPDRVLIETKNIVASADSVILDRCDSWLNLARETVTSRVPEAWIVDLAQEPTENG